MLCLLRIAWHSRAKPLAIFLCAGVDGPRAATAQRAQRNDATGFRGRRTWWTCKAPFPVSSGGFPVGSGVSLGELQNTRRWPVPGVFLPGAVKFPLSAMTTRLLCLATVFLAIVFGRSESRFLPWQHTGALTPSGCVDPTGHLVNEGFSISRTRPCQLETCRNGTWDIARCIEDVDPKCKGQLGTRGPGPYPDCCALAVYCAGH
ncbi:uncharacterized protein LOC142582214 isoform X1 [Dermacentor variabilis]|uniref:uncharacterized protein LOC142582214 isoform X1 n=1 Tax=Dermacentor variabilis TaxID=34621 RepID=UPI003F5B887A